MLMRVNIEDSMATRMSNATGENLLTPAHAERWLACLSLGVMLLGFCVLACEAWQEMLAPFDTSLMQALHAYASPWLTAVMRLITHSGSGWAATALALLWLVERWFLRRHKAEALTLAGSLSTSAVPGYLLKDLIARPRPQVFAWLTQASGLGFPSGHTLTAVVLYGMLAWLLGRDRAGWRRALVYGVGGAWALAVGVSRIYLGVHYPSDVLASLALGVIWLATTAHLARRWLQGQGG